MPDPTNDAPATFTVADRDLLMSIARQLNQTVPADMSQSVQAETSNGSYELPLTTSTAPAYDPPVTEGTAPAPAVATVENPAATPISPTSPVTPPAPVYEPPANSPAVADLPQPKQEVKRTDEIAFTVGDWADLKAAMAILREKFPTAIPDETPLPNT